MAQLAADSLVRLFSQRLSTPINLRFYRFFRWQSALVSRVFGRLIIFLPTLAQPAVLFQQYVDITIK